MYTVGLLFSFPCLVLLEVPSITRRHNGRLLDSAGRGIGVTEEKKTAMRVC